MKRFFDVVTCVVVTACSLSASAGRNSPICEKNPEAPQCRQSRAKPTPQLGEEWQLNFVIARAKRAFDLQTGDVSGEPLCRMTLNEKEILDCAFVSASGRTCRLQVFDTTNRWDYRVACDNGYTNNGRIKRGPLPMKR